jgi:hypothetical protein
MSKDARPQCGCAIHCRICYSFMIQLRFKLQFALLYSAALANLAYCNVTLSNCTNTACLTAADQGVSANILAGIGAKTDLATLTITDLVHI